MAFCAQHRLVVISLGLRLAEQDGMLVLYDFFLGLI
jgi:hypothetical protein